MTPHYKITVLKSAAELLTALRNNEAKGPVLRLRQARLFRSKMVCSVAFTDLLAMAQVEGRS